MKTICKTSKRLREGKYEIYVHGLLAPAWYSKWYQLKAELEAVKDQLFTNEKIHICVGTREQILRRYPSAPYPDDRPKPQKVKAAKSAPLKDTNITECSRPIKFVSIPAPISSVQTDNATPDLTISEQHSELNKTVVSASEGLVNSVAIDSSGTNHTKPPTSWYSSIRTIFLRHLRAKNNRGFRLWSDALPDKDGVYSLLSEVEPGRRGGAQVTKDLYKFYVPSGDLKGLYHSWDMFTCKVTTEDDRICVVEVYAGTGEDIAAYHLDPEEDRLGAIDAPSVNIKHQSKEAAPTADDHTPENISLDPEKKPRPFLTGWDLPIAAESLLFGAMRNSSQAFQRDSHTKAHQDVSSTDAGAKIYSSNPDHVFLGCSNNDINGLAHAAPPSVVRHDIEPVSPRLRDFAIGMPNVATQLTEGIKRPAEASWSTCGSPMSHMPERDKTITGPTIQTSPTSSGRYCVKPDDTLATPTLTATAIPPWPYSKESDMDTFVFDWKNIEISHRSNMEQAESRTTPGAVCNANASRSTCLLSALGLSDQCHPSISDACEAKSATHTYATARQIELSYCDNVDVSPIDQRSAARTSPVCTQQKPEAMPARSIDSKTYLDGLIAASDNTLASIRLLRILQAEGITLDSTLGLKLLDLAKALRQDGELAPPSASSDIPPQGAVSEALEKRLDRFDGMLDVMAKALAQKTQQGEHKDESFDVAGNGRGERGEEDDVNSTSATVSDDAYKDDMPDLTELSNSTRHLLESINALASPNMQSSTSAQYTSEHCANLQQVMQALKRQDRTRGTAQVAADRQQPEPCFSHRLPFGPMTSFPQMGHTIPPISHVHPAYSIHQFCMPRWNGNGLQLNHFDDYIPACPTMFNPTDLHGSLGVPQVAPLAPSTYLTYPPGAPPLRSQADLYATLGWPLGFVPG
ncbi:hypothetical protein IAR55_002774 [Kwoniella newhampshirensis]|uniref:Uncharacterized protein n=1 Tax=Kwoniella newhampshirensis TaxID=1651941 RepID=A0AAW0YXP1_9TREE